VSRQSPVITGAPGAAVSMVTDSAFEAVLTLPSASADLAVMLWVPLARLEAMMLHVPVALVIPVPTAVAPSYRVTVLAASAVPVKDSAVILVILSVFDTPVSDAVVRSSAFGAAGAVASMVIVKAPDAMLTLPAASVALVVILWAPLPIAEVVMVHAPSAPAMPVPTLVVPL
jgi:hypothetical protein